jgi:hypothetical protein
MMGWGVGMDPPFSDPSFDGLRQPHNLIWDEDMFMFIPLSMILIYLLMLLICCMAICD